MPQHSTCSTLFSSAQGMIWSSVCFINFLKNYNLIYLEGIMIEKKERGIFYLQVHSEWPQWLRLAQIEARSLGFHLDPPHMSEGAQVFEPSSSASPDGLAESWNGRRAAGTPTSALIEGAGINGYAMMLAFESFWPWEHSH